MVHSRSSGIHSKSAVVHKNSAVVHSKSAVEALKRLGRVGIGEYFAC